MGRLGLISQIELEARSFAWVLGCLRRGVSGARMSGGVCAAQQQGGGAVDGEDGAAGDGRELGDASAGGAGGGEVVRMGGSRR